MRSKELVNRLEAAQRDLEELQNNLSALKIEVDRNLFMMETTVLNLLDSIEELLKIEES
jgi:hypothetical protein